MADTGKQAEGRPPRRSKTSIGVTVVANTLALVSVLVTLIGVFANIGFSLPSLSVPTIALIVTVIAAITAFYTAAFILIRFVLAALSRVKLDKSDVYFVLALAVAITSLIISHFWR